MAPIASMRGFGCFFINPPTFAITMIYYINIGTNLGDRAANIDAAVAALEARLQATARRSDAVQTSAWGFDSPNLFLNAGVALESEIKPLAMLAVLKDIERSMGSRCHRNADGGYADRIIDLDIMAIDEITIDLPELCVPHRHLADRDFFLRPMAQLAPNWRHPLLHQSASQLLAALQSK